MERLCPWIGDGVMTVRDVVQAAAGVGGGDNLYVEDVFSTYLYTGNSSARSIVNNINLAEEGGLVWVKSRGASRNHHLVDTERGPSTGSSPGKTLWTNSASGETVNNDIVAFNTDGFNIATADPVNNNNENFVSWSFRKAPKFFDVVTWTGDGVPGREISHNLGSVPGCIIVKNLELGTNWIVYHQGANGGVNPEQYSAYLDATNAFMSGGEVVWGDGTTAFAPTSTHFTIYSSNDLNRASSLNTYVAYLFAHNDAGGFGDDGEQNIISCGSYTGTGVAGLAVTLGWDPQWILWKNASQGSNWNLYDNMRSMGVSGDQATLYTNRNLAELTYAQFPFPTATGFIVNEGGAPVNASGDTHIYIAIRRGPMKTPESGTEVFAINTFNAENVTLANQYAGFPIDLLFLAIRNGSALNVITRDRLRKGNYLSTSSSATEAGSSDNYFDNMYGAKWGTGPTPDTNLLAWMFKRAPGFMDVVAYTTEIGSFTRPHNLGVAPEIMILKNRGGFGWYFMSSAAGTDKTFFMQTSIAPYISRSYWPTDPDASNLYLGGQGGAYPYIAYLFASLAGISKCGSYTGTGADLNVDCGFSSGARFVLIKRYDGTQGSNVGDWYVWDSARGIVAGNDPYLLLNSTAAENTSTDYIDPLASGFTVTSSAPAALNASGGSYIFLAIA